MIILKANAKVRLGSEQMMLFTGLNIPSNNNHRNTDKYTLYPNNISFHSSLKNSSQKLKTHIFTKTSHNVYDRTAGFECVLSTLWLRRAENRQSQSGPSPVQRAQANMAATQTMGARERELAQGAEGSREGQNTTSATPIPTPESPLHCTFTILFNYHTAPPLKSVLITLSIILPSNPTRPLKRNVLPLYHKKL